MSHISLRSNFEAECSLLGGILLEKACFLAVAEIIKNPDYFYFKKNKLIWSAMLEGIADNRDLNYSVLSDILLVEISRGEIDVPYITAITDNAAMKHQAVDLANIISENYKARKLMQIYENAKNEMLEKKSYDVWRSVSEKTALLFTNKESNYSIHDLMESFETINSTDDWGRDWGIDCLDQNIGPLSKEATVIIAGRPGHCKTSIASQIMDQWGSKGNKIFFQSMEMSRQEIDMRRLARISGIPLWRIKRGPNYQKNYDDPDYRQSINAAAAKIYELEKNVFVSDRCGLTPDEIALNIKINHEQNGINIFVLDNFHRINFNRSGHREHRHSMEHGLEVIIAACKNNGIMPVILAQLNRGIENGESDREPRLSDLRECGRLEEAATNVLMMFWKYKKTQQEKDKWQIKILNAKSRDGQTGRIFSQYFPDIYLFGSNLNECEVTK